MDAVDFRVLELLCGRLCHELVSPIGAVNNGVELLDEDDPDFVKEALGLIGQSAKKAGQRLQFYRFAYGTAATSASEAGAATPEGRDLTLGLLEGGKVRLDWTARLSLAWQRLACNLVVLAAEALPRGGDVAVRGDEAALEVVAEGNPASVNADAKAALEGALAPDQLGARTIHAFYTARLAERLGARLELSSPAPSRLLLRASR